MKLTSLFADFLRDTVDLNTTRVNNLESSVTAIKNFINNSDWEPDIDDWMGQGSWAHKTIIRPVDQGEFDADLIVFVHPVDEWRAADYINSLYNVFLASDTYKNMVRRYSHCVTITYANEKKIDIAPCIIKRSGFQQLEVCNRTNNEFERSEPRRYTEWLISKNSYSGNNTFRKSTRLIKYLRDIKSRFTCSSVLLTTLLGYRVTQFDKGTASFADTPTALKTLFGRLDDFLQSHPNKPTVYNPYLISEDFASYLNDTQYANFRSSIHRYREWIDDAFDEPNRNKSISKWRRVFGDEFAADVVIEEARSVSRIAVDMLRESVSTAALIAHDAVIDLVSLVRRIGEIALPPGFDDQPHMQQPSWPVANTQSFSINVRAQLYRSRGYGFIRQVSSLEPLPSHHWLYFHAVLANGIAPNRSEFIVKWRITNTDTAAFIARKAMRGGFEESDNDQTRWEQLEYRGVHLAEAFVIRRRDGVQVAQSAPFRVVVE